MKQHSTNNQPGKAIHLLEGIRDKFVIFLKYYLPSVILATAFFIHFFLPHPEPEVFRANKDVSAIDTRVEELKDEIINLAGTGETKTILNLKKQLEEQKSILVSSSERASSVRADHRIFGYPSRHKFVWSLGLGIIITLLSIRIMYFSHSIVDDNERKANSLFGLEGGMVGGYFMSWVFYPGEDLPYAAYMALLVSMGFIGAVLAYYLSKITFNNRSRLKRVVRMLLRIFFGDLEDKEMIRPEKLTDFKELRNDAAERATGVKPIKNG